MFPNVPECSRMFPNVPEGSRMCLNAPNVSERNDPLSGLNSPEDSDTDGLYPQDANSCEANLVIFQTKRNAPVPRGPRGWSSGLGAVGLRLLSPQWATRPLMPRQQLRQA